MSRALGKLVYPEHVEVNINDKESPDGVRKTTVGEERKRVRENVKGITGIHPLVCERKDIRIKPYELVKLKKYIGTASGVGGDSNFTIGNISSGGIQIISEEPLCIGDLIELSFTLDRNYRFEGKIVGGKGKIYGVQFLVSHDSLDSIKKNFMNLITLLISVDLG